MVWLRHWKGNLTREQFIEDLVAKSDWERSALSNSRVYQNRNNIVTVADVIECTPQNCDHGMCRGWQLETGYPQ